MEAHFLLSVARTDRRGSGGLHKSTRIRTPQVRQNAICELVHVARQPPSPTCPSAPYLLSAHSCTPIKVPLDKSALTLIHTYFAVSHTHTHTIIVALPSGLSALPGPSPLSETTSCRLHDLWSLLSRSSRI
ncbi:unnamed protein product [Protopolystoma xenopodis]|uniref:Uncharacterized protein n=1 Tax=Protopolystoma xenopodis TaxID=117903 RepID=A0A3S5CJX4_9PLAT|nr:unnamed protein product [Protopolystoma xenopodis]